MHVLQARGEAEPYAAKLADEIKDDGRSHVGMENTKKRLRDMCGADVTITSAVGKGTTARIVIPKRKENDE